jgi:hypothetical protein
MMEFSDVMVQTRGGFSLLPKTIADVLSSQACKGSLLFPSTLNLGAGYLMGERKKKLFGRSFCLVTGEARVEN